MGQNDGVKKLRELRKEIAQIKTVARERELGIRGATHDVAAGERKDQRKESDQGERKEGSRAK